MKDTNKHLSYDNRKTIENLLNQNCSFSEIANVIKKHRTTISREVFNHRIMKDPRFFNSGYSECIHHKNCTLRGNKPCYKKCKNYKEITCSKTINPPYVCNGCKKKEFCKYRRFFYDYSLAQNDYNNLLIDARNSIHLTKSDINTINTNIKPLIIDNNQSINQISINHPEIINMSKSTFYRYIDKGLFDFRNIDLQRKVKLRFKKEESEIRVKRESEILVGRTYKDFINYIQNNPDTPIVEMDTVIGTQGGKGGKCMLTLLFRQSKIMFIYLLPYKQSQYVTEIFLLIRNQIGIDNFKKYFQVILTDNGSEFFDPLSIEFDYETGEKISNVFYCDSYCSWQKGSIEKNHEYIRYILPKGSSFASLSQDDCYLIASHINSTPRLSLDNNSPYDYALLFLGQNIINKFNIKKINYDDIDLSFRLLK